MAGIGSALPGRIGEFGRAKPSASSTLCLRSYSCRLRGERNSALRSTTKALASW